MFAILTAVLALNAPQQSQASPYDAAMRCAGLTQAASELEGSESSRGRTLFDAALYWSLTAAQAAQAAGRTGTQADADQTRARLRAVRELSAGDAAARTALDACIQRMPNLG
jgi:hypothetical protein